MIGWFWTPSYEKYFTPSVGRKQGEKLELGGERKVVCLKGLTDQMWRSLCPIVKW